MPPAAATATKPLLPPKEAVQQLAAMHGDWKKLLDWRLEWLESAHLYQLAPTNVPWDIWMLLAGRGAGKTKCAANELGWLALSNPGTRALITAPTSGDIRDTCFEGDSGLMNTLPKWAIVKYNSSLNEIILFNDSLLKGIPASEPERYRGPQFHYAWYDELAAMEKPKQAWDLSQMGVRLGKQTKTLITTTPKPISLLRELMKREGDGLIISRASTYQNLSNLSGNFKAKILQLEGTEQGRQEIHGELLDLSESGIWKHSWFRLMDCSDGTPKFQHIIISLDTAFTERTNKDADRTACTVWGVFFDTETKCYNALMLDCWADRISFPELRDKAREMWMASYGEYDQQANTILIEAKGSGISLRQDLQAEGIPVTPFNPGRADKIQRANVVAPLIKDGFIFLPESQKHPGEAATWTDDMMEEITMFPNDDHDDYVDSISQALHYLNQMGYLKSNLNVHRQDEDEEPTYWRKKYHPYAA
jgi:predicted phage terminase large subunit-like protein